MPIKPSSLRSGGFSVSFMWQKFWSFSPPPGSNDLMALIKRRVLKAEGDLQIFMAHLRYFKEALAKLRPGGGSV